MLRIQEYLFSDEDARLAPYAIRSSQSRGRRHQEIEDPYRTPFQRDRDRVIHSKAFRRLSGKTQVFVSSYGDHYRSRLTHSIEVAQVSRGIARALGLNEDLCEVIALAHDLGHTPFGHAGQDAMNEMMLKFKDRFEHNEQSLRIVEKLEQKSTDYSGLNLSFEVLEGMMKHRKIHKDGNPVIHSLESQVVDLSDAIAYHHHDLDDGLRSGILRYEDLSASVEIWEQVIENLSFAELGEDLFRHISIDRVISLLITDIIEESNRLIQEQGLTKPLHEYKEIISFSEKIQRRADELADFLGEHFYLNEKVTRMSAKGQKIIKTLFSVYAKKPELLPRELRQSLDEDKMYILIKDYIAGMTDEFALGLYNEYKDLI